MTKIERLQWENKKTKETLEEIYAICNMKDKERKEYLNKLGCDKASFHPIAVGVIHCIAEETLETVTDKERT